MPTFNSFTVTYNSGAQRYDLTYTYTPDGPSWTMYPYINSNRIGDPATDQTTFTFRIPESSYPEYFTQGISMEMYVESDEGPTQSDHLFRVFMRANDANNIALSSNLRSWTISDANANYTSLILPPIGTYQSNIFSVKYIDAVLSKSFFLVSGFTGYSNAPSTQLLSAVDSIFTGIFDKRFDQGNTNGNVGRTEINASFNYASLSYVSNGSDWLNVGTYVADSNLSFGQLTLPITDSNQQDTNKSILYYNCSDSNLSTIVLSGSIPNNFEKNIYIRNSTSENLTFFIVAPSGFNYENYSQAADRAVLSFPVTSYGFRNIGLLSQYRGAGNRLYITASYTGHNLTALTNYPTGLQTVTKRMTYINSVGPHLLLNAAYPVNGSARIVTIVPTVNGSNSTVSTYNELSNNYFAISSNDGFKTVGLNTNYWYTFAVLYKNATESNVILPLSSWPL